jgi:hypothetical protein
VWTITYIVLFKRPSRGYQLSENGVRKRFLKNSLTSNTEETSYSWNFVIFVKICIYFSMFIVDRNIINKLSKASLGLLNKSRICVDFDFFLDHFTIIEYIFECEHS